MRNRAKFSIVAVFSCCAVMSMGFANWIITQQGPLYESLTGGIEAERADFSNEYIFIEEESRDISPLVYTPEGFAVLDGDEVIKTSYEGTMSVTFTADLEKCSRLGGDGALRVTVSLRLTGTENFAPLASIRSVACADAHISELQFALSEEGDVFTADLTLTPPAKTGTAAFTLRYTFVSSEGSYLSDIYEVFYDSANGKERGAAFSFGVSIRT